MNTHLTTTTTTTTARPRSRRFVARMLRWCSTAILGLVLAAGLALVGPAEMAGAIAPADATLVSHIPGSAVTTGNGYSGDAALSADGNFVAFGSLATNLVTGQTGTNNGADVFLLDRATGEIRLVSHTPGNPTTTADSIADTPPVISADGAFVVFSSRAGNLVSGLGTSGVNQVYLYERATDTVTLVSHAAGSSAGANKDSTKPSISANGAYVAFQSSATNLVAGQAEGNLATDVFLFERATGTIKLVSRNATSQTTTSNGFANKAVISADGAFVAL